MLEIHSPPTAIETPALETHDLSVDFSGQPILRNVSVSIPRNQVFGIIGPSGAGKSTFLRSLNRLLELTPGFKTTGSIHLGGAPIADVDADSLRSRIGMLFQQPVIFPTSIRNNVLFGVRHSRSLSRVEAEDTVRHALEEAALWPEVRDRLRAPATELSVGQQQRLCLARALAMQPEILLMDEPTSALDPAASRAIEDLILQLKEHRTIVIVTHNIEQARRVTDWIACLCPRDGAGEILASACCDALLDSCECQEVVEFLSHG